MMRGWRSCRAAGATEVVPETFEASLTLVSQALTLLQLPAPQVTRVVDTLRTPALRDAAHALLPARGSSRQSSRPSSCARWCCRRRPGRWAGGSRRCARRGAEVAFTAIRRHGITGREPGGDTELREGDVVVIYGVPAALEHAEAVLLAG